MLKSMYQPTRLEEFYTSQYLQENNENPKVYLLPEIHESIQRVANAKFISNIVQQTLSDRVIILVEGVAAGEPTNYITHKQTHQLHQYNLGHIETKGWDIPVEIILDYSTTQAKANRQLENIEEQIREDVALNGGKKFVIYRDTKAEKIIQLQKALEPSMEEIVEKAHHSFQARNYVMMNTIQKVLSTYDVIFVIAGEYHFKSENNPQNHDERYSLDPLYEYLDGIPAVIMHHVPSDKF